SHRALSEHKTLSISWSHYQCCDGAESVVFQGFTIKRRDGPQSIIFQGLAIKGRDSPESIVFYSYAHEYSPVIRPFSTLPSKIKHWFL
ncbi:hypothetical protein Q0U29_15585, partial [Escherichia coli O103:H43]